MLITTTSALGRSSVYNRLKMDGRYVFKSVGFTEGYGHFQFSDCLFWDLVAFLEAQRGEIRGNKYGQGPNWKMRTLRTALEAIELPEELLRHGVKREVFLAPLGQGWRTFLRGETDNVQGFDYSLDRLSDFWRERWAIPRAERRPGYKDFDPAELRLRDTVEELEAVTRNPCRSTRSPAIHLPSRSWPRS